MSYYSSDKAFTICLLKHFKSKQLKLLSSMGIKRRKGKKDQKMSMVRKAEIQKVQIFFNHIIPVLPFELFCSYGGLITNFNVGGRNLIIKKIKDK